MGESQSLADTLVETLTAMRAMNNGIGLEHPERYVIRDLKRNAEALIADAPSRARELAHTAKSIRELQIQRESDPS